MMFKEILRKVTFVLYLISFGILTIVFLFGRATILGNVLFFINSIIIAFVIMKKLKFNETYKKYKELFYILESAHKTRYYLYFSGSESDVKKYSEIVENCSKTLLETGEILLVDINSDKKQRDKIQEIINKTKVLKETIQPPV